ncbi:MAG: sugar ABC transporter substrate-binding protein [Chloroflexia bacterium]|nr:sugar ABC transporter substrate-binding protein [Chloroflexia bacterium]MDQ3410497.1 sugar ABC transporter substrate-binding protein [Chloroflexota bacterium]
MMHRRTFLTISAGLATAPALRWTGALAQDATPTADEDLLDLDRFGPVAASSPYTLAFFQPYPNNEFWQRLQGAVEARAEADGVTVEVYALGSNEVADQVAQMEAAVAAAVDGIILGTINAAGVVPGVEAANNAGIPVIAVDTAPAGGELVSLAQTDNVEASAAAGAFIAEAIGEAGKVLNLQGEMGNQTAQARNEGLHRVLDGFAEIQVIDQSANWTQELGLSITENVLTSDPDLVAIFGANDPAALGAVQAVKAAGRDDIVIVGFDGNPSAFEAVQAGDMAADIAQFPERMGTYGVDLMVLHLNGEEVEALVDTGTAVVTAENVEVFLGIVS